MVPVLWARPYTLCASDPDRAISALYSPPELVQHVTCDPRGSKVEPRVRVGVTGRSVVFLTAVWESDHMYD